MSTLHQNQISKVEQFPERSFELDMCVCLTSQSGGKNGCIMNIKLNAYKTDISFTEFMPQDVDCKV
jgi:hypothetical protein